MPRLLLLRHAKSSWDDAEVDDFDRPLNSRGRRSAPLMGRHCAQHNLVPQAILCSAARRTRETLSGLIPYLAGDIDIRILRDLYMTSQDRHLDHIRGLSDASRTAMLIGHNPTMQDLAVRLIGSGNPSLIAEIEDKFPTAAVAVIDFDLRTWREVADKTGRVVAFFRPRELFAVDGDPLDLDE
jgi:phosphohistidine phosphatase